MAAGGPTVRLSSGKDMPLVGLGTWQSPPEKTIAAIKTAVQNGYRMIDTANDYGNEPDIGDALVELIEKDKTVKREELFIQSKLWNTNHRKDHVRGDLMATLEELKTPYLDSFIIHWPQACPATPGGALALRRDGCYTKPEKEGGLFPLGDDKRYSTDVESHYLETWRAMEQLVDEGLIKSIGVSNFNRMQLLEVYDNAGIKPTINQIECHPYLQQKDMYDFCRAYDIYVQAFSPLGSGGRGSTGSTLLAGGVPRPGMEVLANPYIKELADKHKKSPAQIILNWHVTRGVSCIPKSQTPSRIIENFSIFDFKLSDEEMRGFDKLNVGWRALLWEQTSHHPDYPFKDEIPSPFKIDWSFVA
eukprot:CAMPEP_0201538096 /NCGR_PEP_ID=MMETSP0161_2-20130828/66636_1 /ASSEMBLY_ACC=CAM_ASM_000251 /TAXON_ID=180227 /ORGANISM="Neoparamoeba aestuarina, Strain SoJaBio B1-5/56/2" /LENGTH=359 /DNA_ID=CAMNT_0047944763 /DNA_START=83 /DNA_END=1159 /DNA_ORIENTATION=-